MKSELANRFVYGIIAAALGFLAIYQGGYVFFGAVLILCFLISQEFDNLRQDGKACFVFAAIPVLFSYYPEIALTLTLAAIIIITIIDTNARTSNPWLTISTVYIAIPAISIIWLRQQEHGLPITLWLILVIVATDIGAYFIGKKFGKRLLAPKVSPKKTWEGLIGGTIIAAAASWVYSARTDLLLLAVVFAIIGQLSDLTESAIKRYFGVKDTGNTLPGHGGIMDRLDALMLAAPLAAILKYYGILTW